LPVRKKVDAYVPRRLRSSVPHTAVLP